MTEIFLETTALIDLVFADRTTRELVRSHIPAEASSVSSQYCIYELYRGYFRYLRLLHNKTTQLQRFSEVFTYLQGVRLQRSFAGAITGCMHKYFQESHPQLSDEHRLTHFRGFLRKTIRRGAHKISKVPDRVINDIGCRTAGVPFEDETGLWLQVLGTELCGKYETCGLKQYAHSNRAEFEVLREKLDAAKTKDAETLARIKGLRELYRVLKRNFPKTACFRSSDALIVHEAPSQSVILTKNRRHIEPICTILNKQGDYY